LIIDYRHKCPTTGDFKSSHAMTLPRILSRQMHVPRAYNHVPRHITHHFPTFTLPPQAATSFPSYLSIQPLSTGVEKVNGGINFVYPINSLYACTKEHEDV